MKTIYLPNSYNFVVVDDEDYDSVNKHRWVYSSGYAHRASNGTCIKMARQIMNCQKGIEVDHINRDKLDNRRSNLRIATKAQNIWNSGPRVTSHTGVKGVGWHKRIGKFHARLNHLGKMYHCGYFDSIEDAKEAYAKKATQLRGEFAFVSK